MRHHLDPVGQFDAWTRDMAALPVAPWLEHVDFAVWQDPREMARQRAVITRAAKPMNDGDINALVAFLTALTGTTATQGRLGIPTDVPSGLPIDTGLTSQAVTD